MILMKMRYTVHIPSMTSSQYRGHVCTNMKQALGWAYREAKEHERMAEVKKYRSNTLVATVWRYKGSIEKAYGKMLVRYEPSGNISVLKADGTISKRRVF